jgi:hypothetical protein
LGKRNAYTDLFGKPESKEPLWIREHRWKDDAVLKEILKNRKGER